MSGIGLYHVKMRGLVFFSAQEDQVEPRPPKSVPDATPKKANAKTRVTNSMIAEQLSTLVAQMQVLSHHQDVLEQSTTGSAKGVGDQDRGPLFNAAPKKLPAVAAGIQNPSGVSQTAAAKALAMLSPPPKTAKGGAGLSMLDFQTQDDPVDVLQPGVEEPGNVVAAIAQQSTAITALVAHLASQSPDGLGDLTGPALSSTKGVQRREKMQNHLAMGNSSYFLQVMQQLHRRMCPS